MRKLRGHHLICLHFYDGEGYDGPFIGNLEEVIAAIEQEGVEAVDGPDDVCGPCPHRRGRQCTFSETADREIMEMDARALALLGLAGGKRVEWSRLRKTVRTLFPQWYATHCHLCSWRSACEKNDLFRELKSGVSP